MAKILVIDDQPELRKLLQRVLVKAGHEVLAAADGNEGLRLFREHAPDLVLTDMFMPDREGVETIQELLLRAPGLPIIAMSGHSVADGMLTVAKTLGACRTLCKPFSQEELLATVDRALAGD